jgi:hypothetical protein
MDNRKWRTITSELERGIISYRFLICLIGCAVLVVLGSWEKFFLTKDVIADGLAPGYHLSMVLNVLKSEMTVFVIPILSTLPYGGDFLEEYKSGFDRFLMLRTSRKKYVISKVLTTGLSGSIGIFSGICMITGLLTLVFKPMEVIDAKETGRLLTEILRYSLIASLLGNLWGSMGALLGVLYRNAYMAYGGPFLVNYLLIILFTRYFPKLYVLNPREWLLQEHYGSPDPYVIVILLTEICIIIQLLEGIAIWKRIKQS